MGSGASPSTPAREVCGERFDSRSTSGTTAALFGVADGLGHGAAAEDRGPFAPLRWVDRSRKEPPDVLLQLCHRAPCRHQGAPQSRWPAIDFETDTLSWIGIGNVTADLVAKTPGGANIRASALLAGGIVGYRIPHALATHQVFRSGQATFW